MSARRGIPRPTESEASKNKRRAASSVAVTSSTGEARDQVLTETGGRSITQLGPKALVACSSPPDVELADDLPEELLGLAGGTHVRLALDLVAVEHRRRSPL